MRTDAAIAPLGGRCRVSDFGRGRRKHAKEGASTWSELSKPLGKPRRMQPRFNMISLVLLSLIFLSHTHTHTHTRARARSLCGIPSVSITIRDLTPARVCVCVQHLSIYMR